MKFLLSTITCLFILVSSASGSINNYTDIQTPKMYSEEARFLVSESYDCNYYIELAGQNLYNMDMYEKIADTKKIKVNYNLFIENSSRAIEECNYVNQEIVQDMMQIQLDVEVYYKGKYNEQN